MRRSLAISLMLVLVAAIAPGRAAAEPQRRAERSGAARYRTASETTPPAAPGGASRSAPPTLSGDGVVLAPAPAGVDNVQNEPFVAVNPTDPDHLVAGANDYRNGQGQSGIAVSTNGGDSWTDVGTFDDIGVMPTSPAVDSAGDPALAFAPDGSEVYYSMLAFREDAFNPGGAGGCEGDSGIYVGVSSDGQTGWGVVNAAPNTATVFNDKPMMAVNPDTGRIYLTYTKFIYGTSSACTNNGAPSSTPIMMRTSTNGGQTWSSEIPVSTGGSSTAHPDSHGSQPAVSWNGAVLYVVFESFTTTGCPGAIKDCLVVARSTDNGATFTRTIIHTVTGGYDSLPDATGSFRANNFPSIAVAPSGRVMVVWGATSSGTSDIFFRTSSDGIVTWSSAARVHTVTTRDQFFPWITFDENGVAWVGYLDRRDDSANNEYHAYVSHAHVGSAAPPYSWSDTRLSTQASDPSNTKNFGGNPEEHFIGDYNGIAALPGGGAYMTWVDARSAVGDQDIWGDRMAIVDPNKDDNDSDWTYTSGWQLNLHSVYSGGTRHYTNAGGAYGEITVSGFGGWRYIATKGPNMGMADIFVNGTHYTRVDLYNPTTVQQVAVTERSLSPGTYTIRIKRSGFKNSKSTSGGINIDALYMAPSGVLAGVYQDTHANAWGYTGSWTTQTSSAYSGGARHWSNSRWSRATIVVKGSQVEFRATRGPDMGILAIFMDGVLIANANLYQSSTAHGRTILSRSLTPGYHVFRLEVTGTRDSRSTSGQVNFDVCVVT